MTDNRPLIPVWYCGDGVTEPTRTFLHEGAEWPDIDTDGRTMFACHHHVEWSDARDEILAQARARLSIKTEDLTNIEEDLLRAREAVAETAKAIYAIQQLKDPTPCQEK